MDEISQFQMALHLISRDRRRGSSHALTAGLSSLAELGWKLSVEGPKAAHKGKLENLRLTFTEPSSHPPRLVSPNLCGGLCTTTGTGPTVLTEPRQSPAAVLLLLSSSVWAEVIAITE